MFSFASVTLFIYLIIIIRWYKTNSNTAGEKCRQVYPKKVGYIWVISYIVVSEVGGIPASV